MGRALLPGLGVALGFGIAGGDLLHPGPLPLAAAGVALLLAGWRRSVVALWIAAFAVGLALPVTEALPPHLEFQLPNLKEITGRVLDIPEPRAKNVSFTLVLDSLPVRLLAYVPQAPRVGPGDRVRLVGQWAPPQPEAWRTSLARRGIHGLFWAAELEVLTTGGPGPARWASRVRQDLVAQLDAALSPRAADLLAALLFGARGGSPTRTRKRFAWQAWRTSSPSPGSMWGSSLPGVVAAWAPANPP